MFRATQRPVQLLLAVALVSTFTVTPVTPAAAATRTIYVAKTGSNTNSGTSRSPKLTIQAAVNAASAGDTVIVRAGTYSERVSIKSGVSGAKITVKAATGTKVITRGFSLGSYVRLQGFEITGATGTAVSIGGSHAEVLGNYIHHNRYSAIMPSGSPANYVVVRGNRITRSVGHGVQASGKGWLVEKNDISHLTNIYKGKVVTDDADAFRFFGSGHTFRGNYVHDFLRAENYLDPWPHQDAWQTWDTASNILIENNTVRDFEGQFMMLNGAFRGPVSNITIRNNLFIRNDRGMYGINLRGVKKALIENNTIIDAGYYGVHAANGTTAVQRNNIFYKTGGFSRNPYLREDTSVLSANYDLAYPVKKSTPYAGWSQSKGLWGKNPLFVNPGGGNYGLSAKSPARDSGNGYGPRTDLYGKARVDDPKVPNTGSGPVSYVDRGCVEGSGPGATFSGKMKLNKGAKYTNSRRATISSSVRGAVAMRVDRGKGYGSWKAYKKSRSVRLLSKDGSKRVKVQYRNASGARVTLSDRIVLNTKPPRGTFALNKGRKYTKSRTAYIHSSVKGASRMRITTGSGYGKWLTYSAKRKVRLAPGYGRKRVVVQYRDRAGNAIKRSDTIIRY